MSGQQLMARVVHTLPSSGCKPLVAASPCIRNSGALGLQREWREAWWSTRFLPMSHRSRLTSMVLQEGAKLQLQQGQLNCGVELALLLVEVRADCARRWCIACTATCAGLSASALAAKGGQWVLHWQRP